MYVNINVNLVNSYRVILFCVIIFYNGFLILYFLKIENKYFIMILFKFWEWIFLKYVFCGKIVCMCV